MMKFEFDRQGFGRPAWSVENEVINYKNRQYRIAYIKKIMNSPKTRYPHFIIFFKNNEMLMLYYSNMHLAIQFYEYILANADAVTSDTEYRKNASYVETYSVIQNQIEHQVNIIKKGRSSSK